MRRDSRPLFPPLPAHRRISAGRLLPILGLASAIGLYCGVEPKRQPVTQDVAPVAATLSKSAPSASAIPAALRLVLVNKAQQEAGPQYALRAEAVRNQMPLVARSEQTGVFAHLDAQGIHVGSLNGLQSPLLSLSLSRYGCEGALRNAEPVTPITAAGSNRAEFARAGMTEWYVNSRLGIEQGFTIDKDLGCGGEQKLALEMDLKTSAQVSLVGEGASARLEVRDGQGGQPLRYGDLFAVDADGKELPARMVLSGQKLRLEVQAAGAHYPLTVDPTLSQVQKIVASDAAFFGEFGFSVALSSDGNTAIVGAYGASAGGTTSAGQAYIYTRSGGTFGSEQIISATDKSGSAGFGYSVQISGDGSTVIVGAPNATIAGIMLAGAAYIYTRSGGTFGSEQQLVASDKSDSALFGTSVGISGDGSTAIVGAFQADSGGISTAGQAYIYTRSGGTFGGEQIISATDKSDSASFGSSVGISGDGSTAIVGAFQADSGGISTAGQAYIYTRSGGTFGSEQIISASDKASDADFGVSVGLSGDGSTAIVGAYQAFPGGTSRAGEAYIYTRSGGTFGSEQKLVATDKSARAFFGYSVGLSADGSAVIVGAFDASAGGTASAGAAYIYTRSGGTFGGEQKVFASDRTANAGFGNSVGISGDGSTAIVGANQADAGVTTTAGATYVFAVATSPNGTACTLGSQCTSGICTDGVCCDMACGGTDPSDCRSCLGAQTGLSNGQCGRIQAVANFTCRAAANGKSCDQAEVCDGSSDSCPTDGYKSMGTQCRAAVVGSDGTTCDVAETCPGGSPLCPTDGFKSGGTQCRAAATAADGTSCDVPESCTGGSNACPADAFKAVDTVCRAANGACDAVEKCQGTAACPNNGFAPSTTVCRPAASLCDEQEMCTGSTASCPSDVLKGTTTVCKPPGANPTCDPADFCDGIRVTCPAKYAKVGTTGPQCLAPNKCNGYGSCL